MISANDVNSIYAHTCCNQRRLQDSCTSIPLTSSSESEQLTTILWPRGINRISKAEGGKEPFAKCCMLFQSICHTQTVRKQLQFKSKYQCDKIYICANALPVGFECESRHVVEVQGCPHVRHPGREPVRRSGGRCHSES